MLFIISLISFIAINLAPNSFFASGELNPNITQESIEHLKAIYHPGLNLNAHNQNAPDLVKSQEPRLLAPQKQTSA